MAKFNFVPLLVNEQNLKTIKKTRQLMVLVFVVWTIRRTEKRRKLE